MLIVATDNFNSIYGRCKYRSWQAGGPNPDPSKMGVPFDIIQVVCYATEHEAAADAVYLQDYDKYHDPSTDTVIYAHRSLEDGMFTSGYNACNEDMKALRELFKTVPYKFAAGLFLDTAERNTGRLSNPLLHEEHDVHWNKIHASDLFENCFDGYSMVDMTNLHTLKVNINAMPWLDLNRQQVQWMEMTEMRYFPMLIHPLRLDMIDVHARWEQPTEYPEYNLSLWADTNIPNDNLCGCGFFKKKGYKPLTLFERDIITEHAVRTEMKLFYHNQNRRARAAAFAPNGIGRFHREFSDEFCVRVTKLLIKEGLHITAEQYEELAQMYDNVYAEKMEKEQAEYDKLADECGEKRGPSPFVLMQKNAGIGYMSKELGLV